MPQFCLVHGSTQDAPRPNQASSVCQQQIAKEVFSRLAGLQIVNRYWKVNPWAGQPKLKSAPAALGQMRSEFLKKLTCYSVVVSPFVPFFFFFVGCHSK